MDKKINAEMNSSIPQIKHNCYMCALYECEDRLEYDFGAYFRGETSEKLPVESEGECVCGYDRNRDGSFKDNFDRKTERECCVLDTLMVALEDKELQVARNAAELKELFDKKYPDDKKILI